MKPGLFLHLCGLMAALSLGGCSGPCGDGGQQRAGVIQREIRLAVAGSKSEDPPENIIRGISIMLFNVAGMLEESRYYEQLPERITMNMMTGAPYTLAVCANMSKQLLADSTDKLSAFYTYFAYPDEYSHGMPMSALATVAGEEPSVTILLCPLLSKVSVRMDRRDLDPGVSIKVRSIQVGNCPRSCRVFGENACKGLGDVFPEGFIKSYAQVEGMNIDESPGMSRYVSVYMLENVQGGDLNENACSYIEVKAEYNSPSCHSKGGEYLVYRFYPGEEDRDYSIRRGTALQFTLHPTGTGLGDNSWYVDTSAIVDNS